MYGLEGKFEFIVNWEDLPEVFREEKISEIIRNREDWDYGIPDLNELAKDEQEENSVIRDQVESWITAHFPLYF